MAIRGKYLYFYTREGKTITEWEDQPLVPRVGEQVDLFKIGLGHTPFIVNNIIHKESSVHIYVTEKE